MIELVPAIDIIDGKCVRLTKGDYARQTTYNDNPVEVARTFERMGFTRLHVVDLDGARSKHIVNVEALRAIAENTRLIIDFGGGIKSDDDLEQAFAAGAHMVTVGSIAVSEPERFLTWLERYGADKLILGADVRDGRIAVNGWKEDSREELIPFLRRYVERGVRNVLCTDISKDGMLQGPAIELEQRRHRPSPAGRHPLGGVRKGILRGTAGLREYGEAHHPLPRCEGRNDREGHQLREPTSCRRPRRAR